MANRFSTPHVILFFVFYQFLISKMRTMMIERRASWLAQLGERRSAEREVAGSNPSRTKTQGL